MEYRSLEEKKEQNAQLNIYRFSKTHHNFEVMVKTALLESSETGECSELWPKPKILKPHADTKTYVLVRILC